MTHEGGGVRDMYTVAIAEMWDLMEEGGVSCCVEVGDNELDEAWRHGEGGG